MLGHAILYFQDEEGNWYKTEYTGRFPDPSTAHISIEPADPDFIDKVMNNESIEFIEYTYIYGDFSACLDYAQKHENTDYGGYCPVTNNCLHYVRDTLLQGDFDDPVIERYANKTNKIIPTQYQSQLQMGVRLSNLNNFMSRIIDGFREILVR